ncbi:hypothetical protein DRN85_09755, partial [Methanosarcinales archaeon]
MLKLPLNLSKHIKPIILIIGLLVIGAIFLTINKKQLTINKVEIKIPISYTEPIVIKTFDNFFLIKPVGGKNLKKIEKKENVVKY